MSVCELLRGGVEIAALLNAGVQTPAPKSWLEMPMTNSFVKPAISKSLLRGAVNSR